jgi:hypothetical protein
MAREGDRDTDGRWGGIDRARRWPKAARRWSATAKHVSTSEEWGRCEGVRRSWSGREFLHYNHTRWIRVHEASDRAPFKRRLRLTSGLWPFFDLIRFSNTQTLIFELVTFLMSKVR